MKDGGGGGGGGGGSGGGGGTAFAHAVCLELRGQVGLPGATGALEYLLLAQFGRGAGSAADAEAEPLPPRLGTATANAEPAEPVDEAAAESAAAEAAAAAAEAEAEEEERVDVVLLELRSAPPPVATAADGRGPSGAARPLPGTAQGSPVPSLCAVRGAMRLSPGTGVALIQTDLPTGAAAAGGVGVGGVGVGVGGVGGGGGVAWPLGKALAALPRVAAHAAGVARLRALESELARAGMES
jgi:hypothetical protein